MSLTSEKLLDDPRLSMGQFLDLVELRATKASGEQVLAAYQEMVPPADIHSFLNEICDLVLTLSPEDSEKFDQMMTQSGGINWFELYLFVKEASLVHNNN